MICYETTVSGFLEMKKNREVSGGTNVKPGSFIGGAERDRTVDLLNAIQALSQLSYSPTRRKSNTEKGKLSKSLVPEVGIEPTRGGSPAGF